MPTIPTYKLCRELGCKNPKSRFNSFCVDHGGKDFQTYNPEINNSRKDFNAMYQTKQWKKLRQIQLSIEPMCRGCLVEGRYISANTVDHLFPWAHINKLAFTYNHFQSLCTAHHAEKTQLEQRGIYRRYSDPIVDYRKEDYGRVMGLGDGFRIEGEKLK
jgi:5-methylcytosine-specific restriction endonuclease McrA